MGVLVGFSKAVSDEVGKDIAMQIAAIDDRCGWDGVAAELIARKKIAVKADQGRRQTS